MIYLVEQDTRKKRQNGLNGILQELIKEYNIDLSNYADTSDTKIANLITALQNGSEISFKNFCLLLDTFDLNTSIEVKGDPDKYPDKRHETYNFSVVSSAKDRILSLDIYEDDDILIKFIKRNINDKMITARYLESKMTEKEFKNLKEALQKRMMDIKLFDKICKILDIDPAVIDTKHTSSAESTKAVVAVGYDYTYSYSHGLYCKDLKTD